MIAERLRASLEDVQVEPGGLKAVAAGRELEAPTPRELQQHLANTLYDTLHAGRPEDDGEQPRTLREPAMEAQLAQATPHPATVVEGRLVAVEDAGAIVELDGVRVRVGLDVDGREPGSVLALRLPSARPALSPGFYLADGSRGTRRRGGPTRRVYVHLARPEAAAPAWGAILRRLEELELPYRAKVSSSTRLFPRRDGLVVYLGAGAWHAAEALTDVVAGLDGTGEAVSAFAEPLAPGLATAWEPADDRPGRRGLSFGQHRALAVAEGLVAHACGEAPSREHGLADALRAANVDPTAPARNLTEIRFTQTGDENHPPEGGSPLVCDESEGHSV